MLALTVGLFISSGTAPPVLVDRIVASVEDRVVTRSMIDRRMKLDGSSSRLASRDALIDDLIVVNECERLSITAEREEIDRAIEEVTAVNGVTYDQLVTAVEARGMTLSGYRDELRRQILTHRWVMQQGDQSVNHETPEQLTAWMNSQRHRLIEEARMRQLVDVRDGEP